MPDSGLSACIGLHLTFICVGSFLLRHVPHGPARGMDGPSLTRCASPRRGSRCPDDGATDGFVGGTMLAAGLCPPAALETNI
jgi:hypothetical protein